MRSSMPGQVCTYLDIWRTAYAAGKCLSDQRVQPETERDTNEYYQYSKSDRAVDNRAKHLARCEFNGL